MIIPQCFGSSLRQDSGLRASHLIIGMFLCGAPSIIRLCISVTQLLLSIYNQHYVTTVMSYCVIINLEELWDNLLNSAREPHLWVCCWTSCCLDVAASWRPISDSQLVFDLGRDWDRRQRAPDVRQGILQRSEGMGTSPWTELLW